jgi:hypothetical protein
MLGAAAFLLTACAANDPRNAACAQVTQRDGLRWGYYPAYGCGPVPRARTDFS